MGSAIGTDHHSRLSWRDVPIPKRIARRPRDRRGMPAPYVALTSAERDATIARYGTAKDGELNGLLLASRGPVTGGDWLLGEVHEERQRECQREPRCQVCHLPVSPKRMTYVVDRDWLSLKSELAFRNPPACDVCTEYAIKVCPALVVGARASRLSVYTVTKRRIEYEAYPLHRRDDGMWTEVDRAVFLVRPADQLRGKIVMIRNAYAIPEEFTVEHM